LTLKHETLELKLVKGKIVFKLLSSIIVLFFLASCDFVPGVGPLTNIIIAKPNNNSEIRSNYHIIKINENVISDLQTTGGESLTGRFGNKQLPAIRKISAGDTLSIVIFENAPSGLFSNDISSEYSGSRQVVLPPQVVDNFGYIKIPYAGTFKAEGSTLSDLGKAIEVQLSIRAVEPQVLVNIISMSSNTISVLGEVSRSGEIELSQGGERILSVLAKAGTKVPEAEAVIRLVRSGEIETVPLRTIINIPSENIFVLPGDIIFALREPQIFNAMGAVKKTGQYPISFAEQSVAGALSLAGGLSPNLADRGGVFIFRFETPDVAKNLLPVNTDLKITPMGVPIVYQIDFFNPNSFFWLQEISIQNKDLIYVANAVATELDKFLGIAKRTNSLGF